MFFIWLEMALSLTWDSRQKYSLWSYSLIQINMALFKGGSGGGGGGKVYACMEGVEQQVSE